MRKFDFEIQNGAKMQLKFGDAVKMRFEFGEDIPEPQPVPDWDKYEKDHSDKITVVLLDDNGDETDDIRYFDNLNAALDYLGDRYDESRTDLFNFYYGDSVTVPSSSYWEEYFNVNLFNGLNVNKNNIKMFRYPRKWAYRNNVFKISGFTSSGATKYMTNLKTIVLPEVMSDDSGIILTSNFAIQSGVENVVFRNDQMTQIGNYAFSNCSYLKEIELPHMEGRYAVERYTFRGCSDITITLNNETDSILYSPWGATNATVVWKGWT